MSEIIEFQEAQKNLRNFERQSAAQTLGVICETIATLGLALERIEPFWDSSQLPNEIKRDLWKQLVLSDNFKTHALNIAADPAYIPQKAFRGALDDVGSDATPALARVNKALIYLCTCLEIPLRKVFKIGIKQEIQQANQQQN